MSAFVGMTRAEEGLAAACESLEELAAALGGPALDAEAMESQNMATVASLIALRRSLPHGEPRHALPRRLPAARRRALARPHSRGDAARRTPRDPVGAAPETGARRTGVTAMTIPPLPPIDDTVAAALAEDLGVPPRRSRAWQPTPRCSRAT